MANRKRHEDKALTIPVDGLGSLWASPDEFDKYMASLAPGTMVSLIRIKGRPANKVVIMGSTIHRPTKDV